MTAYLLTPEQHAQLTKYYGLLLDDIDPVEWLDQDLVLMRELLAMLKAMKPRKATRDKKIVNPGFYEVRERK